MCVLLVCVSAETISLQCVFCWSVAVLKRYLYNVCSLSVAVLKRYLYNVCSVAGSVSVLKRYLYNVCCLFVAVLKRYLYNEYSVAGSMSMLKRYLYNEYSVAGSMSMLKRYLYNVSSWSVSVMKRWSLAIHPSLTYSTFYRVREVRVCDLEKIITLQPGQPHAVFVGFLLFSAGWMLSCRQLIIAEDSPHRAMQRITALKAALVFLLLLT